MAQIERGKERAAKKEQAKMERYGERKGPYDGDEEKFSLNSEEEATLIGITCPKCGSPEFKVRGLKGSSSKSIATSLLAGGIGHMVASSKSKTDYELKPIDFQCVECKKKYTTLPNIEPEEELLDEPCEITVKRPSSFVGAALKHQIFLNGVKMGVVSNGKEITFETKTKTNVVFITDPHGSPFKNDYKFTAESGGRHRIEYKK